MDKKIIIPAFAFSGVLISAVGMIFSSSTQPSRWTLAFLVFLVIGTAALAFRALRTQKLLTAIIAGIAVILVASVLFLIATKNL